MRQYYCIFFLFLFVSAGLNSCSNDEFKDLPDQKIQAKLDNDSIRMISSIDELLDVFGIKPEEEKPVVELRKTMDVQNVVALGYTSITQSGLQRLSFGPDLADQLGLSPAIGYNCYYKTVTKLITVPVERGFFNNLSPLCGYQPKTNGSFTYSQRGYSVSSSTTPISLITYLLYIDFDMRGNYVRKHYPCSPEQIQWAYLLM